MRRPLMYLAGVTAVLWSASCARNPTEPVNVSAEVVIGDVAVQWTESSNAHITIPITLRNTGTVPFFYTPCDASLVRIGADGNSVVWARLCNLLQRPYIEVAPGEEMDVSETLEGRLGELEFRDWLAPLSGEYFVQLVGLYSEVGVLGAEHRRSNPFIID